MLKKPVIVIFIDWFDPAYKAGGPIRSVVNLVRFLQDDYDVYVFTSDRDLGDTEPLKNIEPDVWTSYHSSIKVYYASPQKLAWRNILKQLHDIQPDFIYLNSMFSKYYTIYPLLMKRLGLVKCKVILSTKGMLKPTALAFKPFKKKVFIKIFKALALQKIISFHATDFNESKEISNQFGNVKIYSIIDSPSALPEDITSIEKRIGELKIIFIGRIHPIKQLHVLLEALQSIKSTIHFTIIGVMEDLQYWKYCNEIINTLPDTIAVNYKGEVAHAELEGILRQHHIFALPTMGENFGHAIYEALSVGRPVLISDQTPWRNLEIDFAGWDLSVNGPGDFAKVIGEVTQWDQAMFNKWVYGARHLVEKYLAGNELKSSYKNLFS